jgi:hypothetical protein
MYIDINQYQPPNQLRIQEPYEYLLRARYDLEILSDSNTVQVITISSGVVLPFPPTSLQLYYLYIGKFSACFRNKKINISISPQPRGSSAPPNTAYSNRFEISLSNCLAIRNMKQGTKAPFREYYHQDRRGDNSEEYILFANHMSGGVFTPRHY